MRVSSETPIQGDVASVLHGLSRGFSPPPISMPLVELSWDDTGLGVFAKRLVVNGGRMFIECRTKEPGASLDDVRLKALSHRSIEGKCSDGSSFSARTAAVDDSRAALGDMGQKHELRIELACEDWMIRNPMKPAVLWAGLFDGELPRYGGNMRFQTNPPRSRHHFCLRGKSYVYYLVGSGHDDESRWALAVEPKDSDVDHEVLRREMEALAFCFGRPCAVSMLYGLDKDGNPVACMGGGFGACHAGYRRADPPVPDPDGVAFHALSLFSAISTRLADAGGASASARSRADLAAAIGYAVEALCEPSAHSLVIKRMLGALAAARYVLGKDPSMAGDRERWIDWISRQAPQIRGMAHPDRQDALISAVQRAERPGASCLIHMAASSTSRVLDGAPHETIASAERALFGERSEKAPSDERQACLRAVLVALVARAVDYKGPVFGWERREASRFYLRAKPPFWPVEDDGEPAERFLVIAQSAELLEAARNLWPPTFHPPSVPSSGDIGVIARFAAVLKESTDGRVVAFVRPVLPQRSEDDRPEDIGEGEFDFVLQSAQLPTLETVLFSVETRAEGGVVVHGWSDEKDKRIHSEDIVAFLRKVGHAPETDQRIQRLMLIAARETS
jgi:hypothetical protein